MIRNTSAVVLLPDAQLKPLAAHYRAAQMKARGVAAVGAVLFVAAIVVAAWGAEIEPALFVRKLSAFTSYFYRLTRLDSGAPVWSDPAEWFWGLRKWLRLLGETLLIAYSGTLIGGAFAFALSFMTAANLNSSAWMRIGVKRFLEFCRTVPDIVFALIFVVAFGVGALPGILAIIIHTAGALGKQFSELVENIDGAPIEGITASGAGKISAVRFAALPQVLPGFLSYLLLRFEINVRGATVMGFVGAGGIGDELLLTIRRFYYSDVSAILILIIVTVFIIDICTSRLRSLLQHGEPA